jgi:hypothetical protein
LRAEIADGRLDDAVRTAQTRFALARHLGEHPTVIGDLVGIAIAMITLTTLDEMIAQPGCPNLYWALTDLPSPLINTRQGWQGERALAAVEFAGLASNHPMTPDEINKVVEHLSKLYDQGAAKASQRLLSYLDARVHDEALVRAARQRLVDFGLAAEQVGLFPPMQVILLDEKREYEVRRDESIKALNLPYWEVEGPL